jgi:hypothetical protein
MTRDGNHREYEKESIRELKTYKEGKRIERNWENTERKLPYAYQEKTHMLAPTFHTCVSK